MAMELTKISGEKQIYCSSNASKNFRDDFVNMKSVHKLAYVETQLSLLEAI